MKVVLLGLNKNKISGGQYSIYGFYKDRNVVFLNSKEFRGMINYRSPHWIYTAILDNFFFLIYRPKSVIIVHLSGYTRYQRILPILRCDIEVTHYLFENAKCLISNGVNVNDQISMQWSDFEKKQPFLGYNFIYNSSFVQSYYPVSGLVEWPLSPKVKVLKRPTAIKDVVMIGRLVKSKGWEKLDYLLECCNDTQFHVIGNGDLAWHLNDLSTRFQNLTWYGSVSESIKRGVIDKADVFLTLTHFEGFGMPFWECSCQGIPSLVLEAPYANELLYGYPLTLTIEQISDWINKPNLLSIRNAETWLNNYISNA